MSAGDLLDRLANARRIAPGRWTACCPAHESRSRSSLAITETGDGRVLVHCFAGCDVGAVLEAVGMTFEDLFPPRMSVDESAGGRAHRSRMPRPYIGAQMLGAVAGEALVAAVIASDMAKGVPLDEERRARLWAAAGRLTTVAGWADAR